MNGIGKVTAKVLEGVLGSVTLGQLVRKYNCNSELSSLLVGGAYLD